MMHALLLCCSLWSTSEPRIDADRLASFFEVYLKENQLPGAAVVVVDGNGIIFQAGYGLADVPARIPMTPDHVLNIGSVSKTITGTAVMQLVEQGKLRLDQDINELLPFPVRNPAFPDLPITVEQLLTHTSSIEDGAAYDQAYLPGDPPESLLPWLQRYLTPAGTLFAQENFHAHAPGSHYSYSNVGFGLLGALIERVSGETVSAYTRRRILDPLGMTDSGWLLRDLDRSRLARPHGLINADGSPREELPPALATNLPSEPGLFTIPFYGFPTYSDGLLRTSPVQLARFLLAFMNDGRGVVRPETCRRMLTARALTEPEGRTHQMGLAWKQTIRPDGRVWWGHGGGDPGIRTIMYFQPDSRLGFIYFLNGEGPVQPIFRELHQQLFP